MAEEEEAGETAEADDDLPVINFRRLKAASDQFAQATRTQLVNKIGLSDVSDLLRSETIVMQPDKEDAVTVSFLLFYYFLVRRLIQ